jgi:hypothetical protein
MTCRSSAAARAVVLVMTLVLAAQCGGNHSTSSRSTPTTSRGTSSASGGSDSAQFERSATTAQSAPSPLRLGCHQYCQQAGGYGGAPGATAQPVMRFATARTVVPLSDGAVPITLTCLLPFRCSGAVLLEFPPFTGEATAYRGRSDLDVPAHATVTIAVPLSTDGQALLRSQGRIRVLVIADNRAVPECATIPELAATCRRIVTSPGWLPEDGDGLDRYPSVNMDLAASSAAP